MATARFTPQAWYKDQTIEVDPEGPTEWEVGFVPDGVGDDSAESDDLRFHENAPEWVKTWTGPFFVEVERAGWQERE